MKARILLATMLCSVCIVAQTALGSDSLTFENDVIDTTSSSPINFNNAAVDSVPKLVYWIHGISGDEKSWGHVANATKYQVVYPIELYPARWIDGCNISYSHNEHLPITGVADAYSNDIHSWSLDSTRSSFDHDRSIAIAHSQGGIVARSVRKLNHTPTANRPATFNRLITFNSPHGGAQIINSTIGMDPPAQAWIDRGCRRLSSSLVQDFVNSNFWLDHLISPNDINSFTQAACGGLNRTVLPKLIASIRKDVGLSYQIGAPDLDALRQFAPADTMPTILAIGVEEEPVLWRMLHSMTFTTKDSDGTSLLATAPFALDDDDGLPQFVNHLIADYQANQRYQNRVSRVNHRRAVALSITHTLFAFYYEWRSRVARDKARTYHRAHQWLESANMQWKRFIGARRDSTYSNGYICNCIDGNVPYWVSDPSDCGTGNVQEWCFPIPYVENHIIEEPNDGVLTISAQQEYDGNVRAIIRLRKTNHMQVRNCTLTRDLLNRIYNDDYGSEFKLFRK